ncbi:MAG TPA: hypothetical protein VI756_18615 [Blastocatellia bacterium]
MKKRMFALVLVAGMMGSGIGPHWLGFSMNNYHRSGGTRAGRGGIGSAGLQLFIEAVTDPYLPDDRVSLIIHLRNSARRTLSLGWDPKAWWNNFSLDVIAESGEYLARGQSAQEREFDHNLPAGFERLRQMSGSRLPMVLPPGGEVLVIVELTDWYALAQGAPYSVVVHRSVTDAREGVSADVVSNRIKVVVPKGDLERETAGLRLSLTADWRVRQAGEPVYITAHLKNVGKGTIALAWGGDGHWFGPVSLDVVSRSGHWIPRSTGDGTEQVAVRSARGDRTSVTPQPPNPGEDLELNAGDELECSLCLTGLYSLNPEEDYFVRANWMVPISRGGIPVDMESNPITVTISSKVVHTWAEQPAKGSSQF